MATVEFADVTVVAAFVLAEVVEAGMLLADAATRLFVDGAGTIPDGHGLLGFTLVFVVVVLFVPGVAEAPAGTFELGFVVD